MTSKSWTLGQQCRRPLCEYRQEQPRRHDRDDRHRPAGLGQPLGRRGSSFSRCAAQAKETAK